MKKLAFTTLLLSLLLVIQSVQAQPPKKDGPPAVIPVIKDNPKDNPGTPTLEFTTELKVDAGKYVVVDPRKASNVTSITYICTKGGLEQFPSGYLNDARVFIASIPANAPGGMVYGFTAVGSLGDVHVTKEFTITVNGPPPDGKYGLKKFTISTINLFFPGGTGAKDIATVVANSYDKIVTSYKNGTTYNDIISVINAVNAEVAVQKKNITFNNAAWTSVDDKIGTKISDLFATSVISSVDDYIVALEEVSAGLKVVAGITKP